MKIFGIALEASANLHLQEILNALEAAVGEGAGNGGGADKTAASVRDGVVGDFADGEKSSPDALENPRRPEELATAGKSSNCANKSAAVNAATTATDAATAKQSANTDAIELYGIFDRAKFAAHADRAYCDFSEFNAMGFVEILPLICRARRAIKALAAQAVKERADAVLLADSPAFNIPFARALRRAGFAGRIVYFILPQVWAWKRGRVGKLAPLCDDLVGILPFEGEFWGEKFRYFGNPIITSVGGYMRKAAARQICLKSAINGIGEVLVAEEAGAEGAETSGEMGKLSLGKSEKSINLVHKNTSQTKLNSKPLTVAFLPGSRKREIASLMPVFAELAALIRKAAPDARLLLSCANPAAEYGDISGFEVVSDALAAVASADYAYVCSGTASLQTALIGTAFSLVYRARAVDYFIAKNLVKISHIGLSNIILTRCGFEAIHPEFVQNFTAEDLFNELIKANPAKFYQKSLELRKLLGGWDSKNFATMLLRNFT